MAKRGGGSGRKYVRDSIGRFASKGFSGQSSGRGARLKAKGKKRDGGGAIVKPKRIGEMKNTISKSSSKRKVNASSRATDRQIARDIAARSKPATAKRKKTDLQRMQQADRIMGKLAKRQKAVVDKAPSLNEGLKQVRRNNARAGRVNQSLASKGLLAKYTRLTAPADPIRMTPAGKGIPKAQARSKPAAAKPAAARTSKAPANKAKDAYKRARGDARMRNADLRGADAKERRMANSASAKVKNMQRRRSTSEPKAGAEAPRSKQKAREFARIQRAYGNERRAYAAKGDGFGSAKQSRTASVAKRARDIYSGKISASYKTTSRLTRTQNPDVLKARIKKGEKLTAARAKKKSVTANSARVTGKPAAAKPAAANKISRSPRQLNKDEKIARDVMTDKRFKSDRQRVTEMQRRGVKPGTDVVGLVANVRSKQGGGTTGRIKPAALNVREARQMSQKEKWAARAEKRRTQAAKAEANAKRLRDANRKVGDNAFWTQPGLGKQRDKARAGLDKSFKELERAKKLRSRADSLERMSKQNKGDAASRQQSRRDKFDSRKISKGQTVNSTLYGPVKVLRVNKKTVTISLNGGKPFTEDKSRFKEAL